LNGETHPPPRRSDLEERDSRLKDSEMLRYHSDQNESAYTISVESILPVHYDVEDYWRADCIAIHAMPFRRLTRSFIDRFKDVYFLSEESLGGMIHTGCMAMMKAV
jgi:hypothetical protein